MDTRVLHVLVALVLLFGSIDGTTPNAHTDRAHSATATSECTNYHVLSSHNRAQTFYDYNVVHCDRYTDITDGLWYRFMGAAGTAIATSCVFTYRCGTRIPGWMNGAHPTQAEGIVTRKVCYHWNSRCCRWNNNISVRNCGSFYVYQLVRPQSCYFRYCGNGAHITSSISPSSSYSATATSSLSSIVSSSECTNYHVLSSHNRSQTFYTTTVYCDRYTDITDELWYRFMGAAGTAIATSCVSRYRCSTAATGWMNGSHPTQEEGIVTRTVCYHWSSKCCFCNNNIRVRNCGGFYVYQLVRPQYCYYRYCGNGASNASSISPSPSSSYSATATSSLSSIVSSSGLGCTNSPCRNGGTCQNTYYGYRCSCPNGYSGSNCETILGHCTSSPCRNGGTCMITYYGGYSCSCPNGYSGSNCETNLKISVICKDDYMEIDLIKSFFPNVDWRNLHLKNTSCRATTVTWSTITLRTPLDGCGTSYTEDNDTIVFINEVVDYQRDKSGDLNSITRKHLIVFSFYCKYSRRKLVSTSFIPAKKVIHVSEGNFGNFTFAMNLYRTSQYLTPYSPLDYPVPVDLNENLWIQYEVKNTIADLVVFAESCRATTSVHPNSSPQHRFLDKGCVLRDSTMVYHYNSHSSVQRFSIKSFRFVYSNDKLVYLHCDLMVCHRNSANSRCSRECISSRRRREASDNDDSSQLYDLSVGPLNWQDGNSKNDEQTNGDAQSTNVGMSAGLGVVGGLLLIVCGLILFKKLRKLYPSLSNPASDPSPPLAMVVTVNYYEQIPMI